MIIWRGIALIEDDSHFTQWVKQVGRLDHDVAVLNRVLPYLKGTVVDVGANIGTHTVFYARHAERVIAFEPLDAAFACLEHNTRELANVELYKAAAGSSVGKPISMETPQKNYGASYTVAGNSTAVVSIDWLNLDACDYIKLDCEGDEIEVLHGATKTIERFKPVLFVECNASTLERKGLTVQNLLDCIRSLGYTFDGYDASVLACDLVCNHGGDNNGTDSLESREATP